MDINATERKAHTMEINDREYLKETQEALEKLLRAEISKINDVSTEKLVAVERVTDIKLNAIENATAVYKDTTRDHLEGMNEFREQINKERATFWTRELQQQYGMSDKETHDKIEERIKRLESKSDITSGVASQKSVTYTMILAISSLVLAIISFVIRFYG